MSKPDHKLSNKSDPRCHGFDEIKIRANVIPAKAGI